MICWGLGAFGLGLTGVLETNTKEDMGAARELRCCCGAPTWPASPTPAATSPRPSTAAPAWWPSTCARRRPPRTSDESLLIRPGTDAALALGLMHVIIGEQLHDRELRRQHTVGFDELAAHVKDYTPAWAARRHRRSRRAHRGAGARVRGDQAGDDRAGRQLHAQGPQRLAGRARHRLPARADRQSRHRRAAASARATAARTHGQGLADIVAQERRPPGRYIPNQMSSILDALGDGRRARPAALRDRHGLVVRRRRPAGRGLSRQDLVVSYELFMNDTARQLRRRRAAEHVLAGGTGLQEHQHAPLPDAEGPRLHRARRAPARGCSASWRAARPRRFLPVGLRGGRPRRAARPSVDRPRHGGRAARGGRHARAQDLPRGLPRSRVRHAVGQGGVRLRARAGARASRRCPCGKPPSASPYPLTFQPGPHARPLPLVLRPRPGAAVAGQG